MIHLSVREIAGQVPLEASVTTSVLGKKFHLALPEEVADPADNIWEEIRWYFEDYARRDPFSAGRAQSAERSLRFYGLSLALAISTSDVTLGCLTNSSLLISIEYEGESTLRMARIHWEILENVEVWPEERRPSNVSVVRRTKPSIPRDRLKPEFGVKGHSPRHNFLAITARPGRAHDIPHRIVTRSILGIVQEQSVSDRCPSSFQIVRPGTFNALSATLDSHGFGNFDVVHLDMHGLVRDGQAFLRFICSNDGLDGEEDIPVLDVAKLLAKHGVRYVIMNACESASEEGSMSSAARTMIQEGLLLAIGMRYQILDSAIDIFVRNFYSQYVNHGTTFISAAHISRLALQKQPNRRTKFNTDVQVTDYITPIVAVSTEMELCDLRLDHEVSTLALVDEKKVEICGREVDILDLESKTSISNVLPIIASAGTGKTFLARHLCWWWKATGYVEDFVQIDCGMLGGLEFHHIREKIDAALDLASTHGSKDAVTYLNEHKYLIVIDSLDAVQINQESSSSQRALRRFLRKIEPSIVLLLSRFEEQWMKAASEVTYYLNPLDMKASLHLATQEATKMSCDIQTGDRLDLRFLEQCISLVDGNALAISILIRAYKVSCNSFKLLYRKLTDGSVLNGYGEDDCEEDRHRGYVDAHDLVRQQIGTSRVAHIGDDDLRILTPFWKSLPANLANYRIFIQLAKARVAGDGETPVLPKFWLKAGIEGFPTEEFDVAVRGKEFPAIKVSSLRSLEPAFQLCEERGFLFRKSSINANGNDRSVLIHPLMTLVLRSQPFALPKWAAHIVRVAFHRFVSYQTRHWPEGMTAIADPNVQRKLDAAFADYATACSFSLTIKPGYLNCFVLDIIDWSIYHIQRRAPVVLDICDRFLAVFAIPLARNRASLAQNIFFFAYKIYRRIKKIRKIDRGDYTTDARGLLEGRCLNAIHFADVAAKILDVEHDQSELLERIAKNLQNHSGCYKVNLTLLAGARTSLAHHKIGDQDQTSALKDIFKLDQAHFEEYNRNGIGVQSGLVNFDLGRKVAAVEAPEEIDALEQEFRELLNRQLDGIDAAGGKAVIYETLAVLALKRERYEDAFRHIDTATQLFRPFQHGKPQQWKNLLDEREKILEMRTIRGPHSSEAFRVRSPDDDPVRSITTALQRLQDTRVIGSYKVTAAGQEQGHG